MLDLFEELTAEELAFILQLALHLRKVLVIVAFEKLPLLVLSCEVAVEALEKGVKVALKIAL